MLKKEACVGLFHAKMEARKKNKKLIMISPGFSFPQKGENKLLTI